MRGQTTARAVNDAEYWRHCHRSPVGSPARCLCWCGRLYSYVLHNFCCAYSTATAQLTACSVASATQCLEFLWRSSLSTKWCCLPTYFRCQSVSPFPCIVPDGLGGPVGSRDVAIPPYSSGVFWSVFRLKCWLMIFPSASCVTWSFRR